MFTKKNKSENNEKETNQNQSTVKSWITGKLGSFILATAAGYALYHWQVIPKLINYFKKKYSKIYCLYDWDRTGRHLAWLCRNHYDIQPVKFSDSTNPWVMKQGYMRCKDISDFVKVHGKEEFLSRLNSFWL